MNVSINRNKCIGCALCWSDCPEIFKPDQNDSQSRIVEKFKVSDDIARGRIPNRLRELARSAIVHCPASVIQAR